MSTLAALLQPYEPTILLDQQAGPRKRSERREEREREHGLTRPGSPTRHSELQHRARFDRPVVPAQVVYGEASTPGESRRQPGVMGRDRVESERWAGGGEF